ncbi:hypothetical protein ACJDT4_11295 [Clostridium neuense]|uniref:Uncharacterized protein n=1 Tax=Clostridium neuense TaxID=1728934 RepID=A0ABW8TEZ1_9CLOT
MKDIIIILGIVIGFLLIKIGKMKAVNKLQTVGALVIVVCFVVAAPDFIKDAISGFMDGINSGM